MVLVREKMPKQKQPLMIEEELQEEVVVADGRPLTCDWIYSESQRFPRRDYQYSMVRTALLHNTMVCLPTGLGKTFIAATVMANFAQWHPKGKIIFMAPTKPLVMQQAEACYTVMGIDYDLISEMTGDTLPRKREQEWSEKTCFFVTPQVVKNDLSRGFVKPEQIVCLVVDEAHKATSDYAYVSVVRVIAAAGSKCRILALTATPAKDSKGVQAVIDNLLISKLEVRSEADIDIQPYIHSKFTEKVVLRPTPTMERLIDLINDQLRPILAFLAHHRACFSGDPKLVSSAYALRASYENWQRNEQAQVGAGGKPPNIGLVYTYFAKASYWLNLRSKLLVHGLVPMLQDCELLRNNPKPKSFEVQLQGSAPFGQIWALAKKAHEAGEMHPKLREVERLLQEHFAQNKDSRVIIFTTLRASVDALVTVIAKIPEVRCSRFVGQAKSVGDADKVGGGQKQSEQKEVIQRFVKGVLNTLVATCVGEEGLDIGECDLIILYDTTGSPVRLVQRVGRTGRKRQGKCVALLMDGFEASQYDRTKAKGASLLKSLMRDKGTYRFYDPPVVNRGLVPGRRLAEPTLRDVVPQQVTIDEARLRRRTLSAKRGGASSSKRSKMGSQEKADFLAKRFGLSYYGDEVFEDDVGGLLEEDDMLDAVLKDTVLEQQWLAPTQHVVHSERTMLLSDMLEFMDSFQGKCAGLDVEALMLEISAAAPPRLPKSQKKRAPPSIKSRARAKPLYGDDVDGDDDYDSDLEMYLGAGGGGGGGGRRRRRRAPGDDNDDDDNDAEGCIDDENGHGMDEGDDDDDDFVQAPGAGGRKARQQQRDYLSQDYQSLMSSIDMLSPGGDVEYAPSSMWFRNPVVGEDAPPPPPSAPEYTPSSIWFKSPSVATAAPSERITETPSKRGQRGGGEGGDEDELLVPGTPPLTRGSVRTSFPPPGTPAATTPRLSSSVTTSSSLLDDGFDLSYVPERVAQAALKLMRQPAKGLFLPPPPALRDRAAQITLECPVCGCEYPNSTALGFHCFRQHWPQLDAIHYNPSPLDFRASGSSSASSSSAIQTQIALAPPTPNVQFALPTGSGAAVALRRTVPSQSPSTPSISFSLSSQVSPLPLRPAQQPSVAKSGHSTYLPLVPHSPSSASASEYEVDAILDCKVENGQTKYLIRWAGYGMSQSTWEPEESLLPGAEKLLRAFQRTRRAKEEEEEKAKQKKKKKSSAKSNSNNNNNNKKKRKTGGRRRGALAFLDVEAELSGSDGSSDDDDDIEDVDEQGRAVRLSWVVEDHDDIVYSGTPPSQPIDVDPGFYHRVNALNSPEDDFLADLASRHQRRPPPVEKKARLGRRAPQRINSDRGGGDEDDDVVVISSQANPAEKRCAICQVPVTSSSGTLCGSCAQCSLPPPLLFSTREVSSQIIPHLKQGFKKEASSWEIPSYDADFILGAKMAVLRFTAKSFAKNTEKILGDICSAQQRNHSVVVILESSRQGEGVGAAYERALGQLLLIPRVSLLHSPSSEHSARLLNDLHTSACAHSPLALSVTRMNALKNHIAFLTNAPHLGIARACSLLSKFGCLRDIVCATAQDLGRALGIPMEQAKEIAFFFSNKK